LNVIEVNWIYLGGPIDAVFDGGKEWRQVVGTELRRAGYNCFDPFGAYHFNCSSSGSSELDRINRYALLQCDLLLIYIDREQFTVGTFREMEFAVQNGVPVKVLINNSMRHHVAFHDVEIRRIVTDKLDFVAQKAVEFVNE